MASPTHSHASNTGSRRHHTPLLQERSNSLTRRQEMLKLQNGQSSTLHYSASPQQEGADADAAMPGTVVVCGVRSAFPLIPLADEALIASCSAVLETPSPQCSPSSLRGVPCLRRPSSPTAATLFQRQDSGTGNGTSAAGLPPALRTRNRAAHDATGRPPRVRPYDGQEQLAEFDAEAGVEEDRLSWGLEEDDGCEAEDARSASTNAASPHESNGRSSGESAERPDVAVEVIQPLVASSEEASPPSCTKRAPPPSQVVTACVDAHPITETAKAHTPQARHLTYNSDSSLDWLGDDQTASEEVRPRDSRYPTQESLENHSDDCEGRRASQSAGQPPARSCHAQLEQATVSPPCAPTTPTTHRQSVQTTDAEASVKTNAASSTLAAQLLAKTEGRRSSPGAGKETLVVQGEVMPGVLQTVGPRVMSASSDDRSRNQRAGKGSIHVRAAEVEAAHSASWQTQGPQVISASETCRASRQAVESVDPWYTDADQQPSLLQTVSSCNLLGSATDLSGVNSRRKIYGSMVEYHSSTPVQAEETTTVSQASPTTAAEDSADQLQSRCAGAALPPRSPVDESASKRPSLLASRPSSRTGTSDVEEDYDGHPSQARRADPKGATESMVAGAGDCRWGEVDEVQVSALEAHQIRSSRAIARESNSEIHQDESIDVHEENEDSTEYISCYDVACQTSQHLLMSVREEWQGRAQSRQGASGEGDVSKIGPLDPHYVGSNRWMCAAGHLGVQRSTSLCPVAEAPGASESGYCRPRRTPPAAGVVLKRIDTRTPPTPACVVVPAARSKGTGGYCFTREWDAQQQQRQCRLRELQMEQRARRGGTGAAYTSLLLLTSHDMRSRERAAGKEPRTYRYCNLESQQMMVHTGVGRADLELESYNDTLHGAPLIEAQEEDNDGAVKAIEAWKDREVSEQTQLRYPAAAVVSAAGSSNAATNPSPRSHARPAASGSAKASRLCVLC
ncbi:hypothetical protein CGC20_8220 [Leishmania donovani]|uniref:Uncharacterized protein n=1 Tax=Leishmania donovani TaxID=5661 RepID=A0A504X6Y4_LEIDO|nr:hypothetical protein CGC20_8220 [Leishmania donovani]